MTVIDALLNRLAAGIARIASAFAVQWAVDAGDEPRAVDLRTLGIDPRAFTSLSHG